MVVIDCKGFKIDRFYIPPFQLKKGEMLIIECYGGAHFFPLSQQLAALFSGQVKHENITLFEQMGYAEPITEDRFKKIFNPLTIEKYLKNHSKNGRIDDLKLLFLKENQLSNSTPIDRLKQDENRLLSIYAELTKHCGVIFDFLGIGPDSGEQIFDFTLELVNKENKCGILLNNFNDLQDKDLKHIQIQVRE